MNHAEPLLILLGAALTCPASGCDGPGLSTTEVKAAAKERVRKSLGLRADQNLATDIFVGKPKDGDTVICGTVSGLTAQGTWVHSRRFVAATDPARWIQFETPAEARTPDRIGHTSTDMFVDEWAKYCAGERGR